MPGLKAQVDVFRDEYGVPHIYADNAEDLFQAQGFVHAQDRFYEMDIRRHITAGRLSELFGASQVETDTFIRTLGWRRVAEQELGLLSARTRRYLDAYAAGVNTYLRSRSSGDLSLEYSLLALQGLNYRPADWTAVDSLSWLKAMAWDLGSNMRPEIERARMSARVGRDRAAELQPGYPIHDFEPIVDRGAVRDQAFDPEASPGSGRTAPAGLSRRDLEVADARTRGRRSGSDRDPAAARGRRDFSPRIELVGPGRVVDRERQADPRQRPAPGHLDPVDLRAGRTALPVGHSRLSVRRLRLRLRRDAGCGDRQELVDRLGPHHQLRRRPGSLPRAGARRHRAGRRTLRPTSGAYRGDHRGGRGGAADDHRTVVPPRAAPLRRERGSRRRRPCIHGAPSPDPSRSRWPGPR